MSRVGVYAGAGAASAVAVGMAIARAGEEPGALSNWQALLLGLVQGLTELLPISSSGHLVLVPWVADWHYLEENPGFNHTFDVALHLGTLIAVALYFRRDVVTLTRGLFASIRARAVETTEQRLAWLLAAATVPAALAGALGEQFIVDELGEPWQIAGLLAGFALLLYVADRAPTTRTTGDMRLRDALVIGVAQVAALAPGVSRSGVTITAGRFLRLDRDAAARFSFLLLLPTTLGAVIWKGVSDVLLADLPPGSAGPFLVGTLAAAVSGLFAIWALLGYVRTRTYTIFVVYRLVLAAIVVLLIVTGVQSSTF